MKKINIVITSGGTSEKIDNVRKITNSSSGKLGCLIAEELINKENDKIEKINYFCSKSAMKPVSDKIEVIQIENTLDLKNAVENLLTKKSIHYFIHSMAVSDYMVEYVTTLDRIAKTIENSSLDVYSTLLNFDNYITDNKFSSYEENLVIKLKQTPKIISIIKDISPKTFLVGFKLLDNVSSDELINTAIKLKDKNKCDLVVANDLSNIRNNNHIAYIIRNDNSYTKASGKKEIAKKLVGEIFYDKRI